MAFNVLTETHILRWYALVLMLVQIFQFLLFILHPWNAAMSKTHDQNNLCINLSSTEWISKIKVTGFHLFLIWYYDVNYSSSHASHIFAFNRLQYFEAKCIWSESYNIGIELSISNMFSPFEYWNRKMCKHIRCAPLFDWKNAISFTPIDWTCAIFISHNVKMQQSANTSYSVASSSHAIFIDE